MANQKSLFLFPGALSRDPGVEFWMQARSSSVAQYWLEFLRERGEDVTELLHDGRPTLCVGEAAFAYLNILKSHVSIGFFRGSELEDSGGLLEGSGRLMRHVKIKPGREPDRSALERLIELAYQDMRSRL